MATLVEASGNIVFQLVMNSVRELYLPHADAFATLVSHRAELARLYARAATAVEARDGVAATAALDELAADQARSLIG